MNGDETSKPVGARLADLRPSSLSLQRVRELFDTIDEAKGKAGRWWLERHLSFAGNTSALNRWLRVLLEGCFIEEIQGDNGSKVYRKTEVGEKFHRALKDVDYVRVLNSAIKHFSGDRLKA